MSNSPVFRVIIAALFALLVTGCDPAEKAAVEYQLRWQHMVNTDPRGGSKTVQMMIGATGSAVSQTDPVALVLSCTGGITDVYVIWRQYLGVYDPEVTWRVGSGEEVTQTWSLSTDNEATFAPQAVELIKHMMINDRFLIKTSPYASSPVSFEFDTAGLETEIKELREACDW